jgi:hypothetical protein
MPVPSPKGGSEPRRVFSVYKHRTCLAGEHHSDEANVNQRYSFPDCRLSWLEDSYSLFVLARADGVIERWVLQSANEAKADIRSSSDQGQPRGPKR